MSFTLDTVHGSITVNIEIEGDQKKEQIKYLEDLAHIIYALKAKGKQIDAGRALEAYQPYETLCFDCDVETRGRTQNDEYYMVNDKLWESVGVPRLASLCIGCFETRIGRELNHDDFDWDLPINKADYIGRSDRLQDRLRKVL